MIYKFVYSLKDGRVLKHLAYTEREAVTFFTLLCATTCTNLTVMTIPKRKYKYVKR